MIAAPTRQVAYHGLTKMSADERKATYAMPYETQAAQEICTSFICCLA
jgi:hypothetical protein